MVKLWVTLKCKIQLLDLVFFLRGTHSNFYLYEILYYFIKINENLSLSISENAFNGTAMLRLEPNSTEVSLTCNWNSKK